jgi:glycosyltransferase involved in cell wall biosynthesis
MKALDSKVAIVNSTPFCSSGGVNYLAPSEWISLSQWFPLFGKTVLLKPQLYSSNPPEGWLPLPSSINVTSLCSASENMWQRMKNTHLVANKVLQEFDLLYVRMPNYEGWWVYQIAERLGIPLLLELHGDWASSIMEEDKQGLLRRMTRWLRAKHADRAISRMADYAAGIVTIGPVLRDKYALPDKPTLISTNHLLSLASYSPRSDFRLKSPPLILFVGDIQRRKGLPVLFDALRRLQSAGRSFQVALVGDGPLESELIAYAKKEGFFDQVIFTGRISHGPDLLAWYKKADVFVLPSIAAEGVPRVLHEAMALGCPVIATDIGSTAWQLHGGAGIVVQPGNSILLANAICEVLDDDDFRRNLSAKGYRRALDYTLEQQQATLAQFVTNEITEKVGLTQDGHGSSGS